MADQEIERLLAAFGFAAGGLTLAPVAGWAFFFFFSCALDFGIRIGTQNHYLATVVVAVRTVVDSSRRSSYSRYVVGLAS